MIRLSCHGAARQVTGSCHLLETDRIRLLVDCGLFQGGREIEEENAGDFGFDPHTIDLVILTHAHLDHCGRLPLLAKRGFRGRVLATAATRDLTHIVLMDAAGLQEENALHQAQHPRDGVTPPAPLYSADDVSNVMVRFDRPVRYGEKRELAPGLYATFVKAGHILGSASVFLEFETTKGSGVSIFFSGDIGEPGRPLLADADPPPRPPDYVVMETTYGDRDHRPWNDSVDELVTTIEKGSSTQGKTLIPTFALERAQDILYVLAESFEGGRLDPRLPIFLDSPMAISATATFRKYLDELRPETAKRILNRDPFERSNIHYTKEVSESKAINEVQGAAVIMAGSGMCTGGRIRHHLAHYLENSSTSLIFVGYASQGTPARHIIDGGKSLRIFGADVPVRADVHTINGFSAHAGQSQLWAWLQRCGRPRQVFLVHGDYDRGMKAFADRLTQAGHRNWVTPKDGEIFDLDGHGS